VTRSRLWVALAVLLPVLASLIARLSSVDLAYHLRAGAEILATGMIPSADTWTFTVDGGRWVDQQWAAQVVLRLVEAAGGWVGLAAFRAVLVGVIFGALALIGVRRGLDTRTAAVLSLVAFAVAAPALALRPQLLGMVCFVAVLLLVVDRRGHPRRLWLAPIIVAIWANLHGSFFLGPLVVGLAGLEDVHDRSSGARATLLVALACVVAACLTPFGPLVWVYAAGLSTNPSVTAQITEWQPTSLRDVPGMLFFASVLAVIVLIARSGRRLSWPTLAWLGAFFVVGAYAQRGVAWWPLAAVTAIAGTLVPPFPGSPRAETPTMRRVNAVLVGVLLLACVVALPIFRPTVAGSGVPADLVAPAPAGITASLRELARPGDHIFNPQSWGSWLEYALPEQLVAVDSRIEIFPADVWARYEAVADGVGDWKAQLAQWRVDVVVTMAADTALADRLRAAGWQEVYRDADGAVFRSG
jgi:hypothetical protein